MFVNIIVAYEKNKGIGLNNMLPWKISSDLIKFKNLTIGNKNNALIMGKNTWLSLKKSLPFRDNLILSKSLNIDSINNNNITKSFKNENLLKDFLDIKNYDEIWVIGGENIYDLFLNKTDIFKIDKIYITFIDKNIDCDIFFPNIDINKYSFISKSIHMKSNNIIDNSNNNLNLYDIIYTNKYK
tara:strand:- start:1996 stop:2547 length:552 start_codon:yes stop_codon:yes gene_type:complete